MPFTGDTFTHLFDWEKDPQRQEKIINARLEAEFAGIDAGLSTVHTRTREKLGAARTYYVRTDGSDSNDGLTDSSAGAFLTIQKAINVIAENLDIGGQNVTVQVRDGTYSIASTISLKNVIGFAAAGNLVIRGNSSTPANVHVSSTASGFSSNNLFAVWDIKDMKISASGSGISCSNGSQVRFGNIDFGACTTMLVSSGGLVKALGGYSITGDASFAFGSSSYAGVLDISFVTGTLGGTGARSFFRFVNSQTLGIIEATSAAFSGSATGTRYNVVNNSVIQTNGGGANFFPGNAAGTSGSGGQYL